jgi:hypothetical protein
MGVKYILQHAGNKLGLDPAVVDQRTTMLRLLNEACMELYDQADLPDLQDEKVFKVNGNQTITFPAYLGQFRAAREFFSQTPWHINQMRPRYNWANWKDMWRNFRLINKQPFQATPRNEAMAVIKVPFVEDPPIVVTITGSTEQSASITEEITMDAVEKSTVNNFVTYKAIRKDRVNNYNVIIQDIDELQISEIPSDQVEACYLILDVSTFPFLNQDVSIQSHFLEVMFKKSLPWLQDDGQEFPAPDYDNILVNKVIQLFYEETNRPDLALLYDNKATRSTARKMNDRNRATEDTIAFVPNGHDQLLGSIRTNRPRRIWGYGYGYYGGY